MSPILPPIRTAASYQIIPDGCCCTWAWRTSMDPWRWELSVPHPFCPLHSPRDSLEGGPV